MGRPKGSKNKTEDVVAKQEPKEVKLEVETPSTIVEKNVVKGIKENKIPKYGREK